MSRKDTLTELEGRLEDFLTRLAGSEDARLNRFDSLDNLESITVESLRGRYINNRLKDWLDGNVHAIDSGIFDNDEITRIANNLENIRKGLDQTDVESLELIDQIGRLREKGVVPKRKIVLTLKRKPEGRELLDKYIDTLVKEKELLESGEFSDDHLLTILDDLLKSADAKINPIYLHLAGSIIYFLKINGYKVTPFAKRLREIEERRKKAEMAEN